MTDACFMRENSSAAEYEFEVDGTTGALIDWDVESIYD